MFWKKPKPQPWYIKFKAMLIAGFLAIGGPSGIWTSYEWFIEPDFESFAVEAEAGLYGNLLLVTLTTTKIPNVPVTIEISSGDHVISHRHYEEGIPGRLGIKYEEGTELIQLPMPLIFGLEEPLTVRLVFNGWMTLFQPHVETVKTEVYLLEG